MAAWRLRSCGRKSTPTIFPTLLTITRAALYVIGKIRRSGWIPFISDVFPQAVCDFLGDEHQLGFLTAFGLRQCDFTVLDIDRSDFEHLTDAHPALGHQLQHDPVARVSRSENDLINYVLLDDFPLLGALVLEDFFQNWCVARVLDLKINGVADVIEKGFKTGVAVTFGGLFGAFGESGQKGEDLILGDRLDIPVTKLVPEASEKEFIILQRIFFSN